MTFRISLVLLGAVWWAHVGRPAPALAADPPSRPNVVIVMTDDQGWGDVGYYGHPHLKTPHLDTMAAAGLRCDRYYSVCGVCSPTRASQLTGRHHDRLNITYANTGRMLNREITIAELVKTQGYTTGHFGKWHLGALMREVRDSRRGGPGAHHHYSAPWHNGFDVCFSTDAATPTYWGAEGPLAYKNAQVRYWTGPGESILPNANPDYSVCREKTCCFSWVRNPPGKGSLRPVALGAAGGGNDFC